MSGNYGLFVLSHLDLRARPDRTELALKVFFPSDAGMYLAALQRGEEILTHYGKAERLGGLASSLSAQGFGTVIREIPGAP